MQIKPGVSIKGLQPQMLVALTVFDDIWRANGHKLTITAGCDGQHMVGSLHYQGLALDFRTNDLDPKVAAIMILQAKQDLGADFDVVTEADHVHVEWQIHNAP